MLILELDDNERELLSQVVEERLVELSRELRRTESYDFRDALKAKEASLERLAERLRGVAVH
jgi:hypothetical protein